jgi:outer membrane lipoprotein-sorting protein
MPSCRCKKKVAVNDYLEKLNERTRGLESYRCRLEYLFEQPVFESKSLRQGEFFYKKDAQRSLLRINFSTLKEDTSAARPYKDEYIFDGRWLTHIDYKVKQVKRYEQAEQGKQVDAFELVSRSFPIIGFNNVEDLEKQFDVTFAEQKETAAAGTAGLNFKPKAESKYSKDYVSIDLWIDLNEYLPSKIVALNSEKDIYTINFREPAINKTIDNKIFEYKIPEGFTVETENLKEGE